MNSIRHDPVLRVEGLKKRFEGRHAVDGVSFEAKRGTVLGLLGPNGAGKTTTFLCLSGLLRPDAGSILFDGRKLGTERGRTISLIPETPECFPMLTVWEHLLFVARSVDLPAGWQVEGAALLERFGLGEARDVLGRSLSKGMRQKILISAALLHNPDLILLDEPFSGLDVGTGLVLRSLIQELASRGKVILFSSHELETVERVSSRVVILHRGKLVADDSIENLRNLMALPTLEKIFSQLAVEQDSSAMSRQIADLIQA